MRREAYLNDESWHGTYYELAMEYVPGGDDQRLLRAISALWKAPALHGPWRTKEDFGQEPASVSTLEADGSNFLYGTLRATGQLSIGCLSLTVREEQGSDWLDLCLPTGMLDQLFPVDYPLTRASNPSLATVDTHLLAIADHIFRHSPFDLALIGEEASGYIGLAELTAGRPVRGGMLIPPTLAQKLSIERAGAALSSGLLWFP